MSDGINAINDAKMPPLTKALLNGCTAAHSALANTWKFVSIALHRGHRRKKKKKKSTPPRDKEGGGGDEGDEADEENDHAHRIQSAHDQLDVVVLGSEDAGAEGLERRHRDGPGLPRPVAVELNGADVQPRRQPWNGFSAPGPIGDLVFQPHRQPTGFPLLQVADVRDVGPRHHGEIVSHDEQIHLHTTEESVVKRRCPFDSSSTFQMGFTSADSQMRPKLFA